MKSYYARALRRGICPVPRASRDIGGALDQPVISIPDAIPDFDGLLPVDKLANDLRVSLPWWNGVANQMRLQVAWKTFVPDDPNDPDNTNLVGTEYIVTSQEAADSSTVFSLSVPSALLQHGVYILRVLAVSFPGGAENWSARHTVRVDTEAPGGGALPLLTFASNVIASGTIADSDIVAGKLPVWLAHYEGIARGDTIELYIDLTPISELYLDDEPATLPDFISLGYPQADLEVATNGPHAFSYKVTDKAGNDDGSGIIELDVQLNTTPTHIPAPTVPQGDSDGFLNDAEARAGTQVGITQFDNVQALDEILVHWGNTTPANRVALQAGDLNPAPGAPFTDISLPYGLVASEAIIGSVDVTFEVFRKGTSIGVSEVKTVAVDLTLPGGPDPDPDTPEHENLQLLRVRSLSNANKPYPAPDPEDNKIPPGDFDQNATAFIPWLGVDGTEIYKVGDDVIVTWGSQAATPITLKIQQKDIDDAVDLKLTVPGTTIENEGSGAKIPVEYTITRLTSFPPNTNTSKAFPTPVEVIGPNELPGGGVIDEVIFTNLNNFDAIGPNELIGPPGARYNPIEVKVKYSNVEPTDTVELLFSGYDDLVAGTLIPTASYTPPPYPLTAADILRGTYEFKVPAIYHNAVCSQGRVEAYVIFRNSKGSAQSKPVSVYCDVKFPNDPDCSSYLP